MVLHRYMPFSRMLRLLTVVIIVIHAHTLDPSRPKGPRDSFWMLNSDPKTTPTYYGPPRGDACSGLWPLPLHANCSGTVGLQLVAASFQFRQQHPAGHSPLLRRALDRYQAHIFTPSRPHYQQQHGARSIQNIASMPELKTLTVSVASDNETLQLGIDESYSLRIDSGQGSTAARATLQCTVVYGCLRGLETFSQLSYRAVGVHDMVSA